ncbi:MAG: hypothetical protein WBP85_03445 [Terracidiphilus sp.]
MTSLVSTPLVRRCCVIAAAILLAAGIAQAQQSNTSDNSASAPSDSSSQSGLDQFQLAELATPALPAGSAASPGGSAASQYGSGGGHGFHGMFHHWTFEAGGGFNAPTGEDTNESGVVTGTSIPVITWGGNFTVGGGLRFNKYLSVLGEYQFIGDKLPGALISAINNATGGQAGITSGDTHINSITASPVVDLTPKRSNGAYLVGGAGWYHKSTNFQAPEIAFDQFGDEEEENVTVASFTSNQWGASGGLGLYHRFSNVYGDTNHTEVFAEARYLYIHTPPATQANGLGITELIPVTIGFRF